MMFKLSEIQTHINQTIQRVTPWDGTDKVLFIGRTGAGKSTLINYLNGTFYNVKRSNAGKLLAERSGGAEEIAKMGSSMGSETLFPHIIQSHSINQWFSTYPFIQRALLVCHPLIAWVCTYMQWKIPILDYTYCDLAGLADNRGDTKRICAASGTQLLTQTSGSIKGIVVVLDFPSFLPRADEFRSTATALAQILQEKNELTESICFVITQTSARERSTLTKQGILDGYVKEIFSLIEEKEFNEPLNHEEKSLKFMLSHMESLGKDRIIISNIGDYGESRLEVEKMLNQFKKKEAALFNFMAHDGAQTQFNQFLIDQARIFCQKHKKISQDIPNLINQEKEVQKTLLEEIARITNEIKNHEAKKKSMADIDNQLKNLRDQLSKAGAVPGHGGGCAACQTRRAQLEASGGLNGLRQQITDSVKIQAEMNVHNERINDAIDKLNEDFNCTQQLLKQSQKSIATLHQELTELESELTLSKELYTQLYDITRKLGFNHQDIAYFWEIYESAYSETETAQSNSALQELNIFAQNNSLSHQGETPCYAPS